MILLLLGSGLSLTGQSILEQEVDFNIKGVSVPDALFQLSEQTGINISFDSSLFPDKGKISIRRKATLREIINSCLEGYAVKYEISGKTLLLVARPWKYYTISGYIEDSTTGERLIGANLIDTNTGKGTTSNDYGFFSLTLREGNYELDFSYIGYQNRTETFKLQSDQDFQCRLESSTTLSEIIVEASPFGESVLGDNETKTSLSNSRVSPQGRPVGTSLGGNVDVMRTCYDLPGVETGADGFGGMHVRGGDAGQNLILMDGVPIYNPSHALGLVSIFNSSTVKHASLQKGGFSSRYGGRLSSVLDVRTKEGSLRSFGGEAQVGTFYSGLTLEGPLKKEKAGFIISARRTQLEPLLNWYNELGKDDTQEDELGYRFFDINVKTHASISPRDKIYGSFYIGGDSFTNRSVLNEIEMEEGETEEEDKTFSVNSEFGQFIQWGNTIGSLRWNHQYGSKLFSNLTLTYSEFNYFSIVSDGFEVKDDDEEEEAEEEINEKSSYEFSSNIREGAARLDFDFVPSPNHSVRFGGSYRFRQFDSGLIFVEDVDVDFDSLEGFFQEISEENYTIGHETALYVEDRFTKGKFSLDAGLRLSHFSMENNHHFGIEPRLSLGWRLSPKLGIGATVTRMTQFVHLLSTSGAGLPNDIWIPSSDAIAPETAWQFSLGGDWITDAGFSLGTEVYYKQMNNVIAYRENLSFPQLSELNVSDWEEEVTSGRGTSYGWETRLMYQSSRWNAEINYTLAKSTRTFSMLNGGSTFPFSFDRRHALKTNLSIRIAPRVKFSAAWRFNTGRPITLTAGFNDTFLLGTPSEESEDMDILSAYNGYRLPVQHRLDIGFDFIFKKDWGGHHLSLGLYNAYNRKNIIYEYFKLDYRGQNTAELEQFGLLPILPSIGYKVYFSRKGKTDK